MRANLLAVKFKRTYDVRMSTKPTTINAMQARAARAALRLSIKELAERSGLGTRSVNAFELEGEREAQQGTKVAVQVAFERLGVRFTDDGGLAFSAEAIAFAARKAGAEIEGGQ